MKKMRYVSNEEILEREANENSEKITSIPNAVKPNEKIDELVSVPIEKIVAFDRTADIINAKDIRDLLNANKTLIINEILAMLMSEKKSNDEVSYVLSKLEA